MKWRIVTATTVVLGSVVLAGARSVAGTPAAEPGATLAEPPILENLSTLPGVVEVRLTAAATRLSLVPGTTSDVLTYNGRTPGPTLEVREGDRVIVHFKNDLPEPTTIHWHGIHLPANQDGSPFDPIAPGAEHVYEFSIPRGTAGTYWYHPHVHLRTGYQLAKGLFGAIIVRAADDPLPTSIPDRLLILSDQRFDQEGGIDLPELPSPQAHVDNENGREGNVLFVNGQVTPTIPMRNGEVQRWRIINASAARVYRLVIPGQTMLHVGNDGGLFEHPREVAEIVLANAERVEVLVRGVGSPRRPNRLITLPYDRYVPQTRPRDWEQAHELVHIRYLPGPAAAVALPATLRPVPPIDTTTIAATRVISLSQGLINGKMMDMSRVDVTARLGATEIWEVENLVGMDHPFHLHGFQFQVLDRNGVPEPYRSWKDVVNVPKHETVRFVVRYDDFPGKWMFHCHILNHEDNGMMGVLEVKP